MNTFRGGACDGIDLTNGRAEVVRHSGRRAAVLGEQRGQPAQRIPQSPCGVRSASVAAIGTMAVPVIGVVASAIALHEPLGPGQIAALILTLAAVVMATRS